jgi:hypothetical protein
MLSDAPMISHGFSFVLHPISYIVSVPFDDDDID